MSKTRELLQFNPLAADAAAMFMRYYLLLQIDYREVADLRISQRSPLWRVRYVLNGKRYKFEHPTIGTTLSQAMEPLSRRMSEIERVK